MRGSLDLIVDSEVCVYRLYTGHATKGLHRLCVCVRLQEVYAAPLRFLSDTVYDDPWSRHLMSILAPLHYIKVPVTLKHSCNNTHML